MPSETLEDDPCSFRATTTVPKGMKGLPEREVVSGTCPEEVKMKVKMKAKMKIKVKMKMKVKMKVKMKKGHVICHCSEIIY